jgi:hypothetical protein
VKANVITADLIIRREAKWRVVSGGLFGERRELSENYKVRRKFDH